MTAKRSLFGTDGVRGPAGSVLSPELVAGLGRAAASASPSPRPQVVIVRDTRESGPMLEAALAAGIASAGGDAWIAGVLPTPAASVLIRRYGFDLAAVVSASHNPFADNGIKFFGGDGLKLSDQAEAEVERLLESGPPPLPETIGRVSRLHGAVSDYLRALEGRFRLDLSGRRVMLDCANGAAHVAAPSIFRRLGAEVIVLNDSPDGRNINDRCGSTDTERLATRMAGGEADIGFAFDGDADRVIAIDARGEARDGDEIIAIAARSGLAGDSGSGVAVTVMTNFGFHLAMREAGIEVATTPVGDRHVIAEMLRRNWQLGGEQSGHVITPDHVPTGDGIATALMLLEALGDDRLEESRPFTKMPQRMINVTVADRQGLEGAEEVWRAVEAETEVLAGNGRVLLRPSGTEPLVRVMVEAPERAQADEICERLALLVARELDGAVEGM